MTDNGHPPKNIAVAQRFKIEGDIGPQIDQIAKRLPACCEEYNIVTTVTGSELQAQGIFEVKKSSLIQPVEIGQTYEMPGVALRNINHAHKIRKFYYANGIIGVVDYLNQLPGYVATMKGQYPSLWENGTYIGVKEGTQLPVDPEFMDKVRAMQQMHNQINQQ